jgi:hypothetical protein
MNTRRTSILFTGAIGALSVVGQSKAQGKYPDKPVKIIEVSSRVCRTTRRLTSPRSHCWSISRWCSW